jgi:lipoate-protein ligase A
MTSLTNIMCIYQVVYKLLVGDTQTHTDWWFDKPTFIFGKQAKKWEEKGIYEMKSQKDKNQLKIHM